MQRARLVFHGAVYPRRRLPQFSARLSQRREAVAVGPNEMVDLEFLQDRADERSASRAAGIGFRERGERAKDSGDLKMFSLSDQPPSRSRGTMAWQASGEIAES